MTRLLLDIAAIFVTFAACGISWALDTPMRCSDIEDRTARLNATQLFGAAAPCFAEKRPFEATLLMIQGQIRAMADMELLAPKADEDKLVAANLYGLIFYQTGGVGDRELYRDSALTQKPFDRIEAWVPTFGADYDPGWQYRRRPSKTEYDDSIKYLKSYRVAQLRGYAALVRNDQYYAAGTELAEIQRRNPNGIVNGSSDGARAQELSKSMHSIGEGIAKPDLPKPRPFVFTPDPDADFKQIFVGFSGPQRGGVTVIRTKSDAAVSWLASAVSPDDLKRLLSQVNFDSQILVAFAVGERESATGQLFVTDVSYSKLSESFAVSGRVGVNENDCKFERMKSYPFAVVVAPRPPRTPTGSGYSVSSAGPETLFF